MPTVLTHPAIALAVRAVTGRAITSRRLLLIAALCSIVPDVDSVGFVVGIPYDSLLGHRGLTHSLAFALLLAACALPLAKWLDARRWWAFTLVFLSTISHGILDALTDGGLGVAFLSPFSNQRFFLPWRPLPASPIGILAVLSPSEVHVLASEAVLVWLPCLLVAAGALAARSFWRGRRGRHGSGMRPARDRSALATRVWPTFMIATILTIASTIAGAYGGLVSTGSPSAKPPQRERDMLAEAVANLEAQAAKLASRPGPSCPQDFSAMETGRPLRISMFYGYDDHDGRVHDRVHARSMLHVLTSRCRAHLATCGFSIASRSRSAARLTRTLGGREVEVSLFTSSLGDLGAEDTSLLSAYLEQDRLSRTVKGHFYRELVESDVVFYMGHSRLGGSIGFDDQTGLTTVTNAVLRLPLVPVLEALRHRPTRLKVLGMFSCDSNKYFRQVFQDANPSLSLILTTGDIAYAPAEQASLGALEAVLSRNCGRAFHGSMISVTEPDPTMTYLFRGR